MNEDDSESSDASEFPPSDSDEQILALAAERRAALSRDWAARVEEVVYGEIARAPYCATRVVDAQQWWLGLELGRWQRPDKAIEETPLWVAWPAPEVHYAAHLRPGALVALSAKLCQHSALGDARAWLLEWLPAPAEGLRAPAPPAEQWPADPRLGNLRRDGQRSRLVGQITWRERPLVIYLELGRDGSAEAALAGAVQLLDELPQWVERLLDACVEHLLPLKNSRWLDEGEAPVAAPDFRARLQPEAVTLAPDGALEFTFGDGDLFFGHHLQVVANLNGAVRDAKLCR